MPIIILLTTSSINTLTLALDNFVLLYTCIALARHAQVHTQIVFHYIIKKRSSRIGSDISPTSSAIVTPLGISTTYACTDDHLSSKRTRDDFVVRTLEV